MSDSDRWWVIALLVVFMVGGLLWLLLARMRRSTPAATAPEWHEATADELGVVPASASAAAVSTADVTMSREPSAAGVVAVEREALEPEAVEPPSGDEGAAEDAAPDAAQELEAAAIETQPAEPAGGSTLEGLASETGAPTVGSEMSDRSWASSPAAGTTAEPAAVEAVESPAAEAPPEAAPAAAQPRVADSEAPAEPGHADTGVATSSVSAFAMAPEAGAAAVEPVAAQEPVAESATFESAPSAAPAAETTVATGAVTVAEVHHGADGHEHGDTEWVLVTNDGGEAVDLAGWRLSDEGSRHVYTFPTIVLAPGGSLRVHMARGDDSTNDLYVGQNVRWWNNDGDCAYLFDGAGAPVSTHCYGDAVARAGLVTPVTEPAATGDAQVAEVHHGADGHEHGDREWVLIVNNDSRPLQLAGWRLSDEGVKHSYTFGERILAPGASVRVHMARGDDGEADVYVGRNQRWWNNDGDCAYLHDGSGTLVHVHCYGDATASA